MVLYIHQGQGYASTSYWYALGSAFFITLIHPCSAVKQTIIITIIIIPVSQEILLLPQFFLGKFCHYAVIQQQYFLGNLTATLSTKTSYSHLTEPQTLKLKLKLGGCAPPEPLNCLWLAISNQSHATRVSKLSDSSQIP